MAISEATKIAAAHALSLGGQIDDIASTVGIDWIGTITDWLWHYTSSEPRLYGLPAMSVEQALGELADEVDRDRDPDQLDSPDRVPALLECLREGAEPDRVRLARVRAAKAYVPGTRARAA